MDLELLVIGATSAGWRVAVAAAQAGGTVGLVSLPPRADAFRSDLRLLPDELVREVCADWPLLRPLRRSSPSHADVASWRQFTDYAVQAWRQERADHRDRLLVAGGIMWTGAVAMIDSRSVAITDAAGRSLRIAANQMVLATGTRSHLPRFADAHLSGVHEAAGLLDAAAIPQAACVVGAGLTGLRAACLLAWWGAQVTVVDGRASQADLGDEQTAEWLSWAEELGVQFHCGEDVIGLKAQSARRTALTLESGRQLNSESVWLATGRLGETDQLQLDHAGLTVDDRGRLWCDDQQRTWTKSIFAAGDVIGFCPSAGSEADLAGNLNNARCVPAIRPHDREHTAGTSTTIRSRSRSS